MGLYAVYFSPTYSTEKIVKLIVNEMGDYNEIDLSKKMKNQIIYLMKMIYVL